ncbi:MAG TPA: proprotein convertase P-domain-containing protein [Saprospiraceae bacterium]|nr:proprotein convertase P-domain-containing protein [Saprospiraceae bacterium]HMQ83298.1 proprotein convertase P-domain-containing protein [Saprospiraceae bacterium]
MRYKVIIFFFLFLVFNTSFGQSPGPMIATGVAPLDEVEQYLLPKQNNALLLEEEMARRAEGLAPHFAKAIELSISPSTHGNWEWTTDFGWVWRLRIRSAGAYSLNLGFSSYLMPSGGKLLLYDIAKEEVLGPFTPSDNEAHEQLWTPIINGEEIVLELQIPAGARPLLQLQLATVGHDFAGFHQTVVGNCHLDVICGSENGWEIIDPYRDAIQSVAVYGLGGETFCTGFLINNTQSDCRPYFITASHCGITPSNAASVVVYWNYQNSFCREPGTASNGSAGNGQLNLFNTGATYRAGYSITDFTLVELDDPVLPEANAYFAGWSRSATPPRDTAVLVHHPDGLEKRISLFFGDTYPGEWGSGNSEVTGGNHIIVPDWTFGSSEAGSSGAPLFNKAGQVSGQLHGGAAQCGNNQYDSFGAFRASWFGGNTASTSLRYWLDPYNDNPTALDGRWADACQPSISIEANTWNTCAPGALTFQLDLTSGFSGPVYLSVLGLPGTIQASFSSNPATPGGQSTLTLNINANVLPGNYDFQVIGYNGNNSAYVSASISINGGLAQQPVLQTPGNTQVGLPLSPSFAWLPISGATHYEVQISKDISFINLEENISTASINLQNIVLEELECYYWRVRGQGSCGAGPWSEIRMFHTAVAYCNFSAASTQIVPISESGITQVVSEIVVNTTGFVAGLSVTDLDISHTFIGDLSAYLISPSGTVVDLFHRPGVPGDYFGCFGHDVFLDFSDDAANHYQVFENTCNFWTTPAIEGHFKPMESLVDFTGEPVQGIWKLVVTDHWDGDGGSINGWKLDFCLSPASLPQLFYENSQIDACQNETLEFDIYVGAGFNNLVFLSAGNLPPGSQLVYSQLPALPGDQIQVSIQNLVNPGNYNFFLFAVDGSNASTANMSLTVQEAVTAPSLLTPEDNTPVLDDVLNLNWSYIASADTFTIEVATDPWFDTIAIKAKTADDYYVVQDVLPGGEYYWRVTASNRCGSAISAVYRFFVEGSATGAVQQVSDRGLLVFPNPAQDVLRLQPSLTETPFLWRLFNADGQLLLQGEAQGTTSVKVGHLPKGTYWIQVVQGNQVFSEKVILI